MASTKPVSLVPSLDLETQLAASNAGQTTLIIGCDEVGRGSLAGPVMVGACGILSTQLEFGEVSVPAGLQDSKLLTERKREQLFEPLQQWGCAWAVGEASNAEIDEWGISYALGIAALRAIGALETQVITSQTSTENGRILGGTRKVLSKNSDEKMRKLNNDKNILDGDAAFSSESQGVLGEGSRASAAISNGNGAIAGIDTSISCGSGPLSRVSVILDGPHDYISKAVGTFDAPDVPIIPQVTTLVKADRQCATVAAAAVLAKVTRDRLMVELANSNPKYAVYEWQHNKGYGSADHRAAIAEHGPSDLHRISWHLD